LSTFTLDTDFATLTTVPTHARHLHTTTGQVHALVPPIRNRHDQRLMIYRKESKNNSIRLSATDIFGPKIIHGITINGIPDKRVMCLVGSMGPVTVTVSSIARNLRTTI